MGSIHCAARLVGGAGWWWAPPAWRSPPGSPSLREPRDTPAYWRPDRRRASGTAVARQLEKVLRIALDDPSVHALVGIRHVRSPKLGRWTALRALAAWPGGADAAGRSLPRRRNMKPFVSVAVLQRVERGRLSPDAPLPELLPADVVGPFPTAAEDRGPDAASHRSET